MLSRKITITLSCCTFGWMLMIIGLALGFAEFIGLPTEHHVGWAGICITLIGKHLLTRVMVVQLESELEDSTERELEAFRFVQATALIPPPAPRQPGAPPLQPVR